MDNKADFKKQTEELTKKALQKVKVFASPNFVENVLILTKQLSSKEFTEKTLQKFKLYTSQEFAENMLKETKQLSSKEFAEKALQRVKVFTSPEFAESILNQTKQFSSKGFPEKALEIAKKYAMEITGSTISPSGGRTASPRAMRFPYTFTAKMVQFPWVYYIQNNWIYRYYFIAIIICIPIFKKISNVFNSPTNVAKWEELKRKEREKEAQHQH